LSGRLLAHFFQKFLWRRDPHAVFVRNDKNFTAFRALAEFPGVFRFDFHANVAGVATYRD
jgi:hypothetical protein